MLVEAETPRPKLRKGVEKSTPFFRFDFLRIERPNPPCRQGTC